MSSASHFAAAAAAARRTDEEHEAPIGQNDHRRCNDERASGSLLIQRTWAIRRVNRRTRVRERINTLLLEEELTLQLRRHSVAPRQNEEEEEEDETTLKEGTYVVVDWITTVSKASGPAVETGGFQKPPAANDDDENNSNDDDDEHGKKECEVPGKKKKARKRGWNDDCPSASHHGDDGDWPVEECHHLHLDVRVKDQPLVAQIVLCFAQGGPSDCFLLVRGSKTVSGVMMNVMESTLECVISQTPLAPSPADIATFLALPDGAALEVTFGIPPFLASCGLDRISLMVPPRSVQSLLHDMEEEKAGRRKKPPRSKDKESGPVPLLRALQDFVGETFGIDVSQFHLVKVSSSGSAIFGADGRCKFVNLQQVPQILELLRCIVSRRSEDENCSEDNDLLDP